MIFFLWCYGAFCINPPDFIHCNCMGKNDNLKCFILCSTVESHRCFGMTNDFLCLWKYSIALICLLFMLSLSSLYVLATLSFAYFIFSTFRWVTDTYNLFCELSNSLVQSLLLSLFFWAAAFIHLLFYVLLLSVSASVFFPSFVQLLSVCRIISFFPSLCHASALSVPLSVPGKRFCAFAHVTTDNIWVIALVNHRWSLVFIFPMFLYFQGDQMLLFTTPANERWIMFLGIKVFFPLMWGIFHIFVTTWKIILYYILNSCCCCFWVCRFHPGLIIIIISSSSIIFQF